MKISSKQVYTYTEVKGEFSYKVQKAYIYDAESSLRYLEEYKIEGERTTGIMSLEKDPNKRETYQIGRDMFYQAEITDYIKRRIYLMQNPHKSNKYKPTQKLRTQLYIKYRKPIYTRWQVH